MVADGENADVRPGLQHVADGFGIDGVVVGHLDLDQFPAMARRPEAETLAVFARRKVQDHVIGADQGGSRGFEAQHRLALQDHRRQRGAQRLGGLADGQLVEILEGGIEIVGDGPRECAQDHGVRIDRPCAERDDRGIVVEISHFLGPLKALDGASEYIGKPTSPRQCMVQLWHTRLARFALTRL